MVVRYDKNPGAFAEQIDYLLSLPNRREEMGRTGLDLVELYQDLRSTAIYGAKKSHFQDIATIHSAVA